MPDKRIIYIVVLVTYYNYRFQENLGAFTDPKKAFEEAKRMKTWRGVGHIARTKLKSISFDNLETSHIWIQKIPENTTCLSV